MLSDPEQRAEYDQVRAMGSGARFTSAVPAASRGGFEDVFGGMFGGGGRSRRARLPGRTASKTSSAGCSAAAASAGHRGGYQGYGGPTRGRDLTATHDARLPHRDQRRDDHPAAVRAASRSRSRSRRASATARRSGCKGKGEPSPDGGEAGDLVLTVAVRKHPVFERDGLNLRVDLPVTFVEAALGATVEVPTLGGEPVRLRVAAGTPSGRVLRVKGRGVSTHEGHGRPARVRPRRRAQPPERRREEAPRGVRRDSMPAGEPARRAARAGGSAAALMDEHSPIFAIAVAAELAAMHPQTLRQYDRLGLVSPTRTAGKSRRYSMRDVVQLREIARLGAEGLNLEGIRRILELENQVTALQSRVRELESALADELLNRPGRRVFAAGPAGEVISMKAGTRSRRSNQVVVWRPLGHD